MNAPHAYGSIARSFHWLVALLLVLQIPLAFYMVDQPLDPDKLGNYAAHKSIGLLIFPVTALRLAMQGTILLVLIRVHTLAALHHHLARKDGVLGSMLPLVGRGRA
jgi:cytochrome b561